MRKDVKHTASVIVPYQGTGITRLQDVMVHVRCILHDARSTCQRKYTKISNFSIIPGKMDGQLVESGHDMAVARDP